MTYDAFRLFVDLGSRARMIRWFTVAISCYAVTLPRAAGAEKQPATVVEAAKVLDLRTCPVMEGATFPGGRTVAQLFYAVKGDVQKVYAFHEQSLTKAGWKALPGGYLSEQAASGTFARDGFKLSVSVMPAGQPDSVNVSITNHGNVDTGKLPVPDGSAPFYGTPVSTAYLLATPVAEVAESLRAKLMAQDWQPYGQAGDVAYFKQNAVLLSVRVTSAPAQGGKTVVDYSTQQMSADLPAPPNAKRLQYSETPKQLSFDAPASLADIEAFYRQALAAIGWKATTERAIVADFESMLLFRNTQQDMLTLKMRSVDDIARGELQFQTAEEVAELEQLAKSQPMAEAEEPAAKGPQVEFPLPALAKNVEASADTIEFHLPAGKGQTTVESLRKYFKDADWKEESVTLEKITGNLTLIKDSSILTITYVDTGLESAQVTVLCLGGELVRKKTEGKKK